MNTISQAQIENAERSELDTLLLQLAKGAQGGDVHALDLLLFAIMRHRLAEPGVRSVVRDSHGVEESVQDTLIAVANSVHTFRGDSKFTTWLYSVSRFKALAYRRRTTDDVELNEDEKIGDAHRISSIIASRAAVGQELEQLPDAYREAVWMRDVGGLSYDEISVKLDIKVNTVRSRIARGRALVAAGLTGEE